ncbi:MAG: ribonuclease III [Pseudobdellovibrionaceae bacterium]
MSAQFSNYEFKKIELLEQALTHKSFVNENGKRHLPHNEKLEFLGDAVLDLLLSEYLMEKFPTDDEGNLSKKRASLVNESILARIALELQLSERILLGKGEVLSNGNRKPRLLASVYEALLGAVFLDGGFEAVRQITRDHYSQILTEMNPEQDFEHDYKTRLQELAQADLRLGPIYEVTGEEGPSHHPQFQVSLSLQGQVVSQGLGKSKKHAEQEAARIAIENWSQTVAELGLGRK